jgi:hypothetical protein
VSIHTQGVIRQAANILTVQEAIDPADLVPRGLFDDAKRTWSVADAANDVELHG